MLVNKIMTQQVHLVGEGCVAFFLLFFSDFFCFSQNYSYLVKILFFSLFYLILRYSIVIVNCMDPSYCRIVGQAAATGVHQWILADVNELGDKVNFLCLVQLYECADAYVSFH